jgi:protease-4
VIGGFVFLFLIFFTIGMINMMSSDGERWSGFGDKIAIVEIEGQILGSEEIVSQLRRYARNGSVKGILVRINSPGGIVAPSQEIYDEVVRIRDIWEKPVVVSMGTVSASGGYYIACGGDYIFANPGTLTGSIGVIIQYPIVKDLMDKIGVQFKTIKSGQVKDVGSPYKWPSEEDSIMLQAAIDDSYEQFVDVIVRERGLEHEEVLSLADGSIYTGRQALGLGLVDSLGGMEDAISYLAELAGFRDEPKRLYPKEEREVTLFDLLGSLAGEYLDPAKAGGPQMMYLYR